MNDKPFNVIKAEFPEFYNWLSRISRWSNIEDFVIPDYKNGVRVRIYTKENCYSISVKMPRPNDDESQNNNYGYLGCIVWSRKPIAGEDWSRGRDLADGKYCKETWDRILNDIVAYELVKVAKPKKQMID